MKCCIKGSALVLFWVFLSTYVLDTEAIGSVLSDPGVPDGEQIIWRVTRSDEGQTISTVTWNVKTRSDEPVYEINLDSGERKQAKYIIAKSDMRLIWAHIAESVREGKYEVNIHAEGDYQYLVYNFKNKREEKKIELHPDGYDGIALAFSLRGFPFISKKKIDMKITPPFRPGIPLWAWKMWKSYAKLLGEEKVTVPAGTFDCYKLEVAASGGLIKHFTTEYYFWFERKPPYRFVKYQDKDGKAVTELMEIKR